MKKQNNNLESHEFALYYEPLATVIVPHSLNTMVTIQDEQVYHRLVHVLRVQRERTVILFNAQVHVRLNIVQFKSNNTILGIISTYEKNKQLTPSIRFLLPLLKRDDLDAALYSLVEVGVTHIQLITTKKSRSSLVSHEFERLWRVIIAAAEQSKNFVLPDFVKPELFEKVIMSISKDKEPIIFFDPKGNAVYDELDKLKIKNANMINLICGPEGDLDNNEKKLLYEQEVIFCKLTPTILRSVQAVALSSGIIRSFVSS